MCLAKTMNIRFTFYSVCYLFNCKFSLLVISYFISSLAPTSIFQQKTLLLIEYNQEIEKIKQNYDSLLQNEDSTYLQTERELTDLHRKVLLNKSLAENFRGLCPPSPAAQGIQLNVSSIYLVFQNNILIITSFSSFSFVCYDILV
jgi:hypothetical protein